MFFYSQGHETQLVVLSRMSHVYGRGEDYSLILLIVCSRHSLYPEN
jgi:hypothetical protein